MKKYIICSFCLLFILCSVYIYSFDKININPENNLSSESILVNKSQSTIKSDSILIMENCTILENGDNKIDRIQSTMPSIFLGMTRTQVNEQLGKYMDNRTISDLENGLIQFDLIYFSSNCLILRKTYETDADYHKYFIKFTKGCITVFYSDQKTVYEYTDISLTHLPANIAAEVITGKKIKNEKELFDFLENYSS